MRSAAIGPLFLCVSACAKPADDLQAQQRSQWVHDAAAREDAGQAYLMTTRDELRFGDGWYPAEHHPVGDVRAESWRWMGVRSVMQLEGGDGHARRLVIAGWTPAVLGRPTITFLIDGKILTSIVSDGPYRLDIEVPASKVDRRWVDMTMIASAPWVPDTDGRELGVAVNEVRWEKL